jgi:hypothetical protein
VRASGIIRYGKFTIDCAPPVHRRPIGVLRSEAHAARKRETGRNYIGLVHEETEEQHIDISAAAKHRLMDHILDLMAAIFSRRSEAR